MADMGCHGCDAIIDDNELFCPHCGAATIPQKTRTELQMMMDKDAEKKSRWMWRLGAIGAVFGLGFAGAWSLVIGVERIAVDKMIVATLSSIFLFTFLGGILGAVIDALRSR